MNTTIIIGSIFLGISLITCFIMFLLNCFLIWYAYKSSVAIENLNEQLNSVDRDIFIVKNFNVLMQYLADLEHLLKEVWKMDVYQKEPIIEEMMTTVTTTLDKIDELAVAGKYKNSE